MGLFDKLKGAAEKAAEKAKEAAAMAVAAAQEMAEEAKQKAEQERIAAEQAEQARQEAEKAQKEAEKKELYEYLLANYTPYTPGDDEKCDRYRKMATEEEYEELFQLMRERWAKEANERTDQAIEKAAAESNCDIGKGDCCWHQDRFYCTCGDAVDCPRKKHIKARQYGKFYAPEHWPYIKALAATTRLDLGDGTHTYVNATYDVRWGEFISYFFKRFLPSTTASSYEPALERLEGYDRDAVYKNIYTYGLGADNPLMDILYTINEKTNGSLKMSMGMLTYLEGHYGIDMRQEHMKNPSLYDRPFSECVYVARVMDALCDPEKIIKYFKDPAKADINQLYNADGTIKAAGIGGPKNGYYGDEIYNIIESWSEGE